MNFKKTFPSLLVFAFLATVSYADAEQSGPAPGTRAHYAVLTALPNQPPPFFAVDVVYGPDEDIAGAPHRWWQIEIRQEEKADSPVLLQVRFLTREAPQQPDNQPLTILRYLMRTPDNGETLEFQDVHTRQALLPPWLDFQKHFLPHRSQGSALQQGVPETCNYLGHVLTLRSVQPNASWEPWEQAKVLRLDRELLVGTGRNFRDREAHRLPQQPQRQNYDYVPFTAQDYQAMFRAGMNLFTIAPAQEPLVRAEPVFYLRGDDQASPLRYPADLYRSNYLGSVMFMDEPTIIMIGDKLIHNSLRYFSDAAALIRARVQAEYPTSHGYGAYHLEKTLQSRGVNFGNMRLMQFDYPAWETIFETAHYQMEGGLNGFVHEGRYQLAEFDKAVARWLGSQRSHTPDEMLRYHYAYLRGGTRPFNKFWGTSIYGQCDPQIAPQAVTLAYDMGARYVWFWTSDHDHHVPWPEQLALAQRLQEHAKAHPRPSIYGPKPTLDKAIVIPYSYFPSFDNLWWVRVLDKEGVSEASQHYRRLMQAVLNAYHEALQHKEDFDFLIDTSQEPQGYRKTVRIP